MQRVVEAIEVLRLRPMANRISSERRDARKVSGGEWLRTRRRTIDMKAARRRLAPIVAAFSQSRSRTVSFLHLHPLLFPRQSTTPHSALQLVPSYRGSGYAANP
ncbi:MAG TPA: hypothetical protein PLM24_05835 [Methanothrix sp.]|nr:hypothetical protein [Methanothrix sp.]HPJ83372.1 hypothetical protein [Methanothrix sp.]HPR66640.1 hypothetical protein [Methanothrix sp.]